MAVSIDFLICTCANPVNLPFLIVKLTGSNPNSSDCCVYMKYSRVVSQTVFLLQAIVVCLRLFSSRCSSHVSSVVFTASGAHCGQVFCCWRNASCWMMEIRRRGPVNVLALIDLQLTQASADGLNLPGYKLQGLL